MWSRAFRCFLMLIYNQPKLLAFMAFGVWLHRIVSRFPSPWSLGPCLGSLPGCLTVTLILNHCICRVPTTPLLTYSKQMLSSRGPDSMGKPSLYTLTHDSLSLEAYSYFAPDPQDSIRIYVMVSSISLTRLKRFLVCNPPTVLCR